MSERDGNWMEYGGSKELDGSVMSFFFISDILCDVRKLVGWLTWIFDMLATKEACVDLSLCEMYARLRFRFGLLQVREVLW